MPEPAVGVGCRDEGRAAFALETAVTGVPAPEGGPDEGPVEEDEEEVAPRLLGIT